MSNTPFCEPSSGRFELNATYRASRLSTTLFARGGSEPFPPSRRCMYEQPDPTAASTATTTIVLRMRSPQLPCPGSPQSQGARRVSAQDALAEPRQARPHEQQEEPEHRRVPRPQAHVGTRGE